jgi:hypothetical protein
MCSLPQSPPTSEEDEENEFDEVYKFLSLESFASKLLTCLKALLLDCLMCHKLMDA